MANPTSTFDPSRQLKMLSSPDTVDLSSPYPRFLLLSRIVFATFICLSALIGILFSHIQSYTFEYLNVLEASIWLMCGLSAPVVLYRDPAIWMKILAFSVIMIFSIDFLKNTW